LRAAQILQNSVISLYKSRSYGEIFEIHENPTRRKPPILTRGFYRIIPTFLTGEAIVVSMSNLLSGVKKTWELSYKISLKQPVSDQDRPRRRLDYEDRSGLDLSPTGSC
jgi:hypothetical protein